MESNQPLMHRLVLQLDKLEWFILYSDNYDQEPFTVAGPFKTKCQVVSVMDTMVRRLSSYGYKIESEDRNCMFYGVYFTIENPWNGINKV